jgi:two-component system OmpR family sensor kinase
MPVDSARRRIPLRWLIGGSYALVLAAALTALGGAIYLQVERHLWQAGESRLRYQLESKWNRQPETRQAPGTPQLPALPGFPGWAPDVARELSTADVHIRVVLPDATIIARQGGPPTVPPVDLARVVAVEGALAQGVRGDSAYMVEHEGERWQVVQVPLVEYRGRYVGLVQANASMRQSDELLAGLRSYLLVGGSAALLAGIALGLAVARVLATPLERLAAATRRLAAGDLAARTGLRGGQNELHAVARAFDEMAERVEETFAAQRRFLADASHELKTPLTSVGGMAELLRAGADAGDPAQRELALRTIERQVDRMGRLVADLLALSRSEQGSAEVRAPVDLVALAEDVVDEALAEGARRTIHVTNGAPVTTVGDAEQLRRALRNLVDNARQHTPDGGAVAVECAAVGEWAELAVRDTGRGIAPEHLPHVFERFYRADPSRSRKTGGSGLGLAIVRAIVERHGGTVGVESELGKGTTVTMRLPRRNV